MAPGIRAANPLPKEHRNGTPPIAKPVAPPRIPKIAECEIEVRVVPSVERFSVRLWRSIRKLVRQRQESIAVRQALKDRDLAVTTARIEATRLKSQHSEKCQAYERKIAELESSLKAKTREWKELDEVDVPRYKNEIRRLKMDVELLEALHGKALTFVKKDIAAYDATIVNAETSGMQMMQGRQ